MSRLVGDLLLLARADAGRAGKHVPCDLAEIAGNAAVEVAPLIGDRELDIDNQHALPVTANPDELHRMVLNLLDNASRHTPPGARIELHVRRVGDEAIVEVADDGPGIPPSLREQIFDRFVRGEGPADTAVGAGSGPHGGTVEVSESDAGGAQFRVRIPLQRTQQPASTF
jgi:two-component system OmpR family sensor kinase